MVFKSLHHVLGSLESQYKPQAQQQLQSLISCWADIVGDVVAAQTRPLTVQRGVLRVATASSAWAQNLIFERQRILAKLNAVLPYTLEDIRFSTAQWESKPLLRPTGSEEQTQLWRQHPSRADGYLKTGARQIRDITDPLHAFEHWANIMRSRASQLPCCPQCQCPTPKGELDRWKVCSLCITKHW